MIDFGYHNMDCMEGMKEIPDKFFDLAICDPPYGGGFTEGDGCKGWFTKYHQNADLKQYNRFGSKDSLFEKYKREGKGLWDIAPSKEYFDELARISKNQIIWGGNYFDLPPTRCFLIFRKKQIPLEGFSMSPIEYAWTSFNDNARMFEAYSSGGSGREDRFHPTQKPVALYEWLLTNYAKQGDKILDTHVGSASSLIACENMGFQYVGFEIDKEYYDLGVERLEKNRRQIKLF